MRQTHQCPKCSATEVLHIPRVRDSQQGTMCIHTEQGWVENRLYGRLEAYVCGACGFTRGSTPTARSAFPAARLRR